MFGNTQSGARKGEHLRAQQEQIQESLKRVADIDAREKVVREREATLEGEYEAKRAALEAIEAEHRQLNETLNRRATELGEQIRAHAERSE